MVSTLWVKVLLDGLARNDKGRLQNHVEGGSQLSQSEAVYGVPIYLYLSPECWPEPLD